jgi:hypothetical protein
VGDERVRGCSSVIDGDSGALLETTRQQIRRLNLMSVSNVAQATPEIKRTAWHLKHPNRSELVFAHGQKTGVRLPVARFLSDICRRQLAFSTGLIDTWNSWIPLTAQPRDADFKSTRDEYGRSAEDEFETIAARMSGQHWEMAWKNDVRYVAPPRDSNDWRWSHRQSSVLEVEERNEEDDD